MPERDGTGPTGIGSMTGKGLGKCKNKKLTHSRPRMKRGFNLGSNRERKT